MRRSENSEPKDGVRESGDEGGDVKAIDSLYESGETTSLEQLGEAGGLDVERVTVIEIGKRLGSEAFF